MLCRLYQWKIEQELDDTGAVRRPLLMHHLEKCRRCRVYYRHLLALSEQLPTTLSGQLTESQLQQVYTTVQNALSDNPLSQTAQNKESAKPVHAMSTAMRSAVAILILSAAAGLWFLANQPGPSDSAAKWSFDSQRFQTQVAMLLGTPERSIQGELVNLRNDVRGAVDFIRSCTPQAPSDIAAIMNTDEPVNQ